ncbi:hypothetical protein ACIQPR_48505 [Streptomyces sp. NPDC091280]|uniref:hypothetical protein n=1 Tax=Streptomyces sp. NPDC091280 TaxID=3365984 RepID=UPI0037FB0FB9
MRVRVTTSLGLVAVTALGLYVCSTDTSEQKPTTPSSTRTGAPAGADTAPASPLSSAALATRLLSEQDLGSGYTLKPENSSSQHEDVTVLGCPALNDLGGDAVTGGSLDFPYRAKAAFIDADSSNSEVTEELYSDTAAKLSTGTGRIFDVMVSCPKYQVLAGSTLLHVGVQPIPAARLGDEQWSQLLTYSTNGQRTVVKQTAVRTGTVLVIVSGTPALVDAHITGAVRTAVSR